MVEGALDLCYAIVLPTTIACTPADNAILMGMKV
jgi:hypothetical protein